MEIKKEYQVIIIGGGATGAGVARDCAMRGIKTLLLEKGPIASGATGRNHGLLHSGARYAVTDPESAEECIVENRILRKIAPHCIEDTKGLFISLPEDDKSYMGKFIEACSAVGIGTRPLSPSEALEIEPSANPALTGAVEVPDASIDPFRLASSNVIAATQNGADVKTRCEVIGILTGGGAVKGVEFIEMSAGQSESAYAPVIINAGGIWGQRISEYAGIKIKMLPAKGSLLIFSHRINNTVINRCRKPGDADILVPGDTISLIGTTSSAVPYESIDDVRVTRGEVETLLREGAKLAPALAHARILRAYAGIRPLLAMDGDETGRKIGRGIALLDHEERDGLRGFITITGGKLMTYRLMAEMAADLACRKLGINAICRTAHVPLPGVASNMKNVKKRIISLPASARKTLIDRQGAFVAEAEISGKKSLVCECEQVSLSEVELAAKHLGAKNLSDLRTRTRLGMGTCQGGLCACRAANIMRVITGKSHRETIEELRVFLDERWKGARPVLWGDAMREAEFSAWIYNSILGLDSTT